MNRKVLLSVATLAAAAAMLAGCASSERMMRVSPLSDRPVRTKTPDRPLDDDRVNAFPLYYGAAGVHAVLWPLVDWDTRGMAVRPLYNRDGANASVLFPLSGWDPAGGWALNMVWDEKKGFLFLPVAGKWNGTGFVGPAFSDGGEHYGLFPVFGRYGDTTQVLNVFVTKNPKGPSTVAAYPFYYDSGDTLWISELYARHREPNGDENRRSLGGLLYRQHDSKDGKTSDLWLFPVGYFSEDHGRHTAITLPYSSTSDSQGSSFNLHPLWWSETHGKSYSRTLIPFYTASGDARGESSASLLWSTGTEGSSSWFNIHPLWWSSRDKDSSSQCLVPFYYASGSPKESALATLLWSHGNSGKEEWLNIHPLWWSSESPTESSRLLIPLWYSHRTPDGRADFNPLWSSGTAGRDSWFNIHPLWWSHTDGKSSSQILFPLYSRSESPNQSDTLTPLWSSGKSGDTTYLNIHPLWWSSETPKSSTQVLFPFHYAHADATGDRTVNLLWSAGHEGTESWFNLHPFWWSSSSGDARSSVALAPLLYSEKGKGGRFTATLLGAHHADTQGDTDMVNALGLGFHWSRDGDGGTYTHTLWPLFGTHAGSGDKKHRPSTATLAALDTTPHYTGFRITPILSVQSADNDAPMPRLIPNLIDFRSGDKHSASHVFPIWMQETTENSSDLRITPLYSRTRGVAEPEWREWAHLYRNNSDENRTDWSVTPLVAHTSGADGGSTRVTPVFASETHSDGTRHLRILPFYSENKSPQHYVSSGFWDAFCLWRRDTDASQDTTAVLGLLWQDTARTYTREPDASPLFFPGEEKSRRSVWTPLTEKVDSETYRWKDGGPDAEDCRKLDRWFRSRRMLAEMDHDRPARRKLDKDVASQRLEVVKVLTENGYATGDESDDALIAAIRELAKEHTVVTSKKSFEVDPIAIPLYRESEEDGTGDWSLLFGIAHGDKSPTHERTRVLRYLYDREKSPEGVRMNCFPFVQYDSLKTREKFAFLWRVFDRETNPATGETKGHILFIPY